MILSETLMNNFDRSVLNEEDLQLKGKTSAKVITHKDTDGLISGIVMVQALMKRGIPKDRITVKFAQYGDDDKSYEKFLPKNNSEYVAVTDFAKFPKVKVYDVFNILVGWENGRKLFKKFATKDFKSMKFEDFKKMMKSEYSIKETKFADDNLESLYYGMKAIQDDIKSGKINLNAPSAELRQIKAVTAKPNSVNDHHSNSNGSLTGGEKGEIEVHSPSEASYAANKYTPGMWSKEDLAAIDMVDSAGYTREQLRNTIFLEKHFAGKDKKKNLATIITVLGTQIIKKNPNLAAKIVKDSGTNLVSVYTNILNALKIDKKEKAIYDALKDGDVAKAKQIAEEIGDKNLTKGWWDENKFSKTGNLNDLDSFRAKNLKDAKKHLKGKYLDDESYKILKDKKATKEEKDAIDKSKTSDIISFHNFSIQNIRNPKGYPERYINSVYVDPKTGRMNPFGMKKFPQFIQPSKNPLYKGEVDFSEVAKKVLPEIRKKLMDSGLLDEKAVNKIMDTMLEENGGHKAIYSFQGFSKIEMPYNVKVAYYYNKDFLDRAKKVKGNMDPEKYKSMTEKANKGFGYANKEKEKYDKLRREIMEYTASRVVFWTNKMYPVDTSKLEDLKPLDKSFVGKE